MKVFKWLVHTVSHEHMSDPVSSVIPTLSSGEGNKSQPHSALQDKSLDLYESPTGAPTVGQVVDTFSSRLDGSNAFRLPTLCADAGALGPFWLAAASLTGLGHLHMATTGQDSYSFALADDGQAVICAAADGLGSRPSSAQIGATLLTRMLCARLARLPTDGVLTSPQPSFATALAEVNDDLCSFRHKLGLHLEDRDLSSTLAFIWIPTDHRTRPSFAGRIGDCAVFTLSESAYETIFERGEGPLNVVKACLPRTPPLDELELKKLDLSTQQAIILATDGLADDLFNSPAVRAWLAKCWSSRCGAFRMLDALRYRRQGSHDDRTALTVWLEPLYEQQTPLEDPGKGRTGAKAPDAPPSTTTSAV